MPQMYILQSELNGRYYIGSAVDVSIRLSRHNAGHHISTKAWRPWKVIYTETFDTLSEAWCREREIKSWKNPQYMLKTLHLED